MNREAKDTNEANADYPSGPLEAVDVGRPEEDAAADTLEVPGDGRIVATVGPLRDGAYEKVR